MKPVFSTASIVVRVALLLVATMFVNPNWEKIVLYVQLIALLVVFAVMVSAHPRKWKAVASKIVLRSRQIAVTVPVCPER